jgi:hypothetical protein
MKLKSYVTSDSFRQSAWKFREINYDIVLKKLSCCLFSTQGMSPALSVENENYYHMRMGKSRRDDHKKRNFPHYMTENMT